MDTEGETAVLLCEGEPSHAARKAPLLARRDLDPDDDLATMSPREATPAQLAVARAALAAVPGEGGPLHYARVDLVPGPDGAPVVIELELTEPSLFLRFAPGSAARYAAALARRLPPAR